MTRQRKRGPCIVKEMIASHERWKSISPNAPPLDFTLNDLRGLSLDDADLSSVVMTGANLTGSTMRRANLKRVVLTGANLTDVDLSEATLEQASLLGATLRKANLAGTDMKGAYLVGATLSEAAIAGCRVNLWSISMSRYPLSWWLERGAMVDE